MLKNLDVAIPKGVAWRGSLRASRALEANHLRSWWESLGG